jgi:anti-anti-sigma regulatory factor
MFRFDKVERDGVMVISLFGGLDAMTAPSFKAEVVAIAELGKTQVVVELANLTLSAC